MTDMTQQASDTADVRAGFYGKHSDFGDFVSAGLSDALVSHLEYWLNIMLPDLRDGVADAWESHYDSAPPMRIWIGPALTPEGRGFCGSMVANRDKVGRRFPLLAGVEGCSLPPPSVDPDQTYYDKVDGFLANYRRGDEDARGLARLFGSALLPGLKTTEPLQSPDFWAGRQDGDVERLWEDVADADWIRATASRTYLWRSSPEGSALYVTEGLPGAAVFAWMMGASYSPPQQQEATAL